MPASHSTEVTAGITCSNPTSQNLSQRFCGRLNVQFILHCWQYCINRMYWCTIRIHVLWNISPLRIKKSYKILSLKEISYGCLFNDWYILVCFSDTVSWLPSNFPLQTKNIIPKIKDQPKCKVLAVWSKAC